MDTTIVRCCIMSAVLFATLGEARAQQRRITALSEAEEWPGSGTGGSECCECVVNLDCGVPRC